MPKKKIDSFGGNPNDVQKKNIQDAATATMPFITALT